MMRSMNDRVSVTLTSLTASFLIMATAASIMIAWVGDDWTLFIPAMLLLGGMFALFIGFRQRAGAFGRREVGEGNFLMFWGTLLMAIGTIWVVNYAYPGNWLFLLIAFLLWLALAILLFTLRRR
ncbi:MAG: hypothetical protein JXA45_04720 [Methanomassiliicoccales archaeon]|nr:hypothetical protein [Methanomassiliicoccales archaeon]